MKKRIVVLVALVLCLFMVSRVSAASDWICGTVSTEPVSVVYGVTFYTFSFDVSSSSDPAITGTITVIALASPTMGQTLNYSGTLVSDTGNGMPIGAFLASSINGGSPAFNGTGILAQFLNALVTLGNMLSAGVVQLVQSAMGYSLTPLLASVLLLSVLSAFFMFFGKHLPWYIDIVGFVVFISVIISLAVGTGLFSL